MPKPSDSKKKPAKKRAAREGEDVNEWAFRMVQGSTKEQEAPPANLDPSLISQVMSELGRRGGKRGGKKRMAMLTPKERSKLGSEAAKARWGTKKKAS